MFQLSEQLVNKILNVIDSGLVKGLGKPIPGQMCVEAAICYALDLPHTDDPGCVDQTIRLLKIILNDSSWSSDLVRAKGLRKLAILQLGTKDNFDSVLFVQQLVPLAKSAAKSANYAAKYAAKYAKYAAESAAKYAKYDAESAVKYAKYAAESAESAKYVAGSANYAAKSAKYAAESAKYAAKQDKILLTFIKGVENILIDMKVPAVKYLRNLA